MPHTLTGIKKNKWARVRMFKGLLLLGSSMRMVRALRELKFLQCPLHRIVAT